MTPPRGSGSSRAEHRAWPVKHATSYGGVVVRKSEDQIEVALIRPSRGPAGSAKEVWALPKGAKEEHEAPEEAALREVREETGLDADIVQPLDPFTYWFVWAPEKVRYRKTVHFFLMRHTGGDPSRHDNEVEEVRFFRSDEAAQRASYASERTVISSALERASAW